jgi:hypothetical protein
MKEIKLLSVVLMLTVAIGATPGWTQKYEMTIKELEKFKAPFDDPSPFYTKVEGFR